MVPLTLIYKAQGYICLFDALCKLQENDTVDDHA